MQLLDRYLEAMKFWLPESEQEDILKELSENILAQAEDKEEELGKYTLAELEEEEQGLDRLRRWYRELRSRDLLGIPATTDSATTLKLCEERFETYAEHVYAALSSPTT